MKRLFTLVFIFLSLQLFSQNTWTGAVNNRWDNAGNWSYGYIPVAGEDVEILSNAKVIIPNGYNAECLDLTMTEFNSSFSDTLIIRPNATLTVGGSPQIYYLLNEGTLFTSQVTYFKGPVINDGKIHNTVDVYTTFIQNDGVGFINNDTIIASRISVSSNNFINNGIIEIPTESHPTEVYVGLRVGASVNGQDSGQLTNYGKITKTGPQQAIYCSSIITNETSGIIRIDETINNYSYYEVELESTFDDCIFINKGNLSLNNSNSNGYYGLKVSGVDATFNNASNGNITTGERLVTPLFIEQGATFNNAGTLNVTEGGNGEMIAGTASFNNSGGTIEGDGDISIANFSNSGLFSPGQSPGKITRTGNLNLGSSAYKCEISGTAGPGVTGGNDLLEITDNLNLGGGQLNVLLIDGFVPSIGDQFIIVTAGTTLTNTFGTINYPALPAGFWEITYNTNNVTLSVVLNPLPIELSQFTVEKNENRHDLKWTTASEQNSSHFEIEYSTDGIDWKNIAIEQAQGNSEVTNHYAIPNFYPNRFSALHYYRLKMVDLDQTYEYSDIISLSDQVKKEFSIFPNPTTNGIINIQGFSEGNFQVFDQLGRLVKTGTLDENGILNLSTIGKGLYILKIQSEGNSFTEEIIIK